MSGIRLSFTSLMAKDVIGLSDFYKNVFDLATVPSLDSPHFRGLRSERIVLGFNGPHAYELLNLPQPDEGAYGVSSLLTFDVDERDQVDVLTTKAVDAGATLRWGPGETYYGAWQSTLLDPEGNAFRINCLEIEEIAALGS